MFFMNSVFQGGKTELRKVPVPQNRYGPLKENWMKIFTPIVEHLHLQVRFNLKTRNVEIKVNITFSVKIYIIRNLAVGIFLSVIQNLNYYTPTT